VFEASLPAKWFGRAVHRMRDNTRSGSRQNISFHYDMGNDFYAQWLDAGLIYSSALYATGDESLEEAQAAKIDRIAQLLAPSPGNSVLEIGCGWGALALALAQGHGARVTGLTLSAEQLAHAQQRVQEEGLSAQVDLRLQDYRDVQGSYDRIVSIEMLEAVGERYWPVYFDTLQRRLAPGGTAVVQVITIADQHFEQYRRSPDFIQRFIFPGGMLPTVRALEGRPRGPCAGVRRIVRRQLRGHARGMAAPLSCSMAVHRAAWVRRLVQAAVGVLPLLLRGGLSVGAGRRGALHAEARAEPGWRYTDRPSNCVTGIACRSMPSMQRRLMAAIGSPDGALASP
jgi:cyclopropane fatty-acyl-phospholipid synthase-like methyltransferase